MTRTVQRITDTASAFDAEKLHPGILLSCYLSIAQNYVFLDQPDSAMEYLRLYTDLACGDIYPLHLHGDAYFDLLDKWICKNLYLGDSLPRDEALIRHSMTQALSENPAFEASGCFFLGLIFFFSCFIRPAAVSGIGTATKNKRGGTEP